MTPFPARSHRDVREGPYALRPALASLVKDDIKTVPTVGHCFFLTLEGRTSTASFL